MPNFGIFLFPILSSLKNGESHWYLISIDCTCSLKEVRIWDSIWQSFREKDKIWDRHIVRRLIDFLQAIDGSSAQWQYNIEWERNIATTPESGRHSSSVDSGTHVCQFAKHLAL